MLPSVPDLNSIISDLQMIASLVFQIRQITEKTAADWRVFFQLVEELPGAERVHGAGCTIDPVILSQ